MDPHLETLITARSPAHDLALHQVGRRPRCFAPRNVFLPLVALLALLTGTALLTLGATMAEPRSSRVVAPSMPPTSAPATAVTTVHAFYAALNQTLRTANPAPLDALLAPGLVEHADRPGLPSGRDGLVRYLAALRQTYPTLHFEVDALLADGDLVTVQVAARAPGLPSLRDGLPTPDVSWRGMDAFRVVEGQVTERWAGSDAPSLIQPLARVPLDHWPQGTSQTVAARLSFAPGAAVSGAVLPGVGVIVVETGGLTVRGSGGTQLVRGSGGPGTRPVVVQPGTEQVLGSGDAVVFPSGTGTLSLRNAASDPVEALAVGWFPLAAFQDPRAAGPPGQPNHPLQMMLAADVGLALAMLPLGDGGRHRAYPGITVTPLAHPGHLSAAQVPPLPVIMTLDRVTVAPRASLPPRAARGPEFLIMETGTLGLVPVREPARIRTGIGEEPIADAGREIPLTLGATAFWDAGAMTVLRGSSDTTGTGLLLAITAAAPMARH